MNSNLTSEIWFPTFISYAYNRDLLPKIKKTFDEFNWESVKDHRYANGYTTFYGGHELNEKLKESMPEFCDYVLDNCYELLHRQKIDIKQRKLKLTTFWLSRMLTNGYHAKHIHAHSFYSGTFYVNANTDSAKIRFHDPRLYKQFSPDILSGEVIEYRAEEGKLMLWDSFLEHEVDTNFSTTPRDAISFNVILEK